MVGVRLYRLVVVWGVSFPLGWVRGLPCLLHCLQSLFVGVLDHPAETMYFLQCLLVDQNELNTPVQNARSWFASVSFNDFSRAYDPPSLQGFSSPKKTDPSYCVNG